MDKPRLILASQSLGRKMLLETLKIPFSVMPSGIDEDSITGPDPAQTIRLRAKRKCEDITAKIKDQRSKIKNTNEKSNREDSSVGTGYDPNFILQTSNFPVMVLSADSGAIVDGKIYGKPDSLENARAMLGTLSGRVQTFVTCSYITLLTKDIRNNIKPEIILDDTDTSFVTFRKISEKEIDLYLSLTDYKRYAGSYALYTSPQFFISKIEGSLSSVVGLPLEKIIPVFVRFGLIGKS